MRVLVTGAAGFVGRYVVDALVRQGREPLLQDVVFPTPPEHQHWTFDLRDTQAMNEAIRDGKPDACIHLGAISFVPEAEKTPGRLLDVNVAGTTRLLDAMRNHAPSARILVVSTAQVYGTHPHNAAICESDPIRPTSLYAISKAAADFAALGYADAYGLDVMTARPGNHTGPGQADHFAVASFAAKIKAVALGRAKHIRIGNLESTRDFSDVRDVVAAYLLLLEKGHTATAYNISSGHHVKMAEIVDHLCDAAGVNPTRQIDPSLYRPTDAAPQLDTRRIQSHTSWQPQISVMQTLRDIYKTTD